MNDQSSSKSDPSFEQRVRQFFQLGLEQGCPKDQLRNFSNAGVILQPRQLAASAAARLCDQPDGPKEIGYGGARGGGKSHWLLAQMAIGAVTDKALSKTSEDRVCLGGLCAP